MVSWITLNSVCVKPNGRWKSHWRKKEAALEYDFLLSRARDCGYELSVQAFRRAGIKLLDVPNS
jgi:hypothetical protein